MPMTSVTLRPGVDVERTPSLNEAGISQSQNIRFKNGLLAQFHDAFTIRHASTGLQVHGTDGSLFAEDVMTQEPKGRLFIRKEETQKEIDPGPPENLYFHQVQHFNAAIRGQGKPFTTGEDGIRSLAVALAVLESTKNGRSVPVSYDR